MTWVASRLVDPSGAPIEGACVKARLLSAPTWLADGTGRVADKLVTHTDADGLWRLNLIPYSDFEAQIAECTHYQVIEGSNPPLHTIIRVPADADPSAQFWLRDLVFDPTTCTAAGTGWVAANALPRLVDVDQQSLAGARPGDVLTLLPNGMWGASGGFTLSGDENLRA